MGSGPSFSPCCRDELAEGEAADALVGGTLRAATEEDVRSLFDLPIPFDRSESIGGLSTVSKAAYAEPCQTLIFLDFDDTIFPTTALFDQWQLSSRNKETWAEIKLTHEQEKQLGQWRSITYEFLHIARALSNRVVVVTNSMFPWVADCIEFFAPNLRDHFVPEAGGSLAESEGGIRVVYACDSTLMENDMGRPVQGKSINDNMTQAEIAAYLTAAKANAMDKVARQFYKQYPNQSWKNILSLGDASYEHDAVQDVAFSRESPKQERLRTKAIVLLQEPSVSQLVIGMCLGRHLLPAFVRWDGDLDVNMSSLQTEPGAEKNAVLAKLLGREINSTEDLRSLVEATLQDESESASRKELLNGLWNWILNSTPKFTLPTNSNHSLCQRKEIEVESNLVEPDSEFEGGRGFARKDASPPCMCFHGHREGFTLSEGEDRK